MEDDKKQVIPDFTLGDKPTEDGLLPLAQAVQMFNSVSGSSLSYQKAYLGVVSGKLPAVRQGGRWFVEPSVAVADFSISSSSTISQNMSGSSSQTTPTFADVLSDSGMKLSQVSRVLGERAKDAGIRDRDWYKVARNAALGGELKTNGLSGHDMRINDGDAEKFIETVIKKEDKQ